MKIKFIPRAQKTYRQLSLSIQRKTDKSLLFLIKDPKHPSLHTKKMKAKENVWEARIDYQYRFTFIKKKATYFILSIGPHDTGLGKK